MLGGLIDVLDTSSITVFMCYAQACIEIHDYV